jgi:uncharacterized protein (PEP-CTERM system associated)
MATTTTEFARQRAQRLHRKTRARSWHLAVATVAIGAALPGQANEYRFTPTISVTETLTDNVRLAPRGSEEGDLVTQVSPGFTFSANGPRIKAQLTYSLQSTLYATSGTGASLSNFLNGSANATLIRDLLYVDASANIGQQNISAFGAQSFSNANANGNSSEVRTYRISPYMVNRYGSFASSQVRYTHEGVSANSSLLQTTGTDRLQANLNSGPRYLRVNWGLQGSTEKIHYTGQPDVSLSNASANVGYLIVPTLRLTAVGGYENNNYVTTGDKPQGGYYTAGFIWTPSSRTNVTANAGHRYFGNTYFLAASHRARKAVFNIDYSDDITTSQAQLLTSGVSSTAQQLNLLYTPTIADPLARQQFVNTIIQQFGLSTTTGTPVTSFTNRYFLQKSLRGTVSYSSARSTIVGSLFDIRRTPVEQTTAVFGIDDATKQIGATGSLNVQLSPRTNAVAGLSYSRNTSLTINDVSTYKTARLALTSTIQPKLSVSLEARHSQQSSGSFTNDVRENALTATALMKF